MTLLLPAERQEKIRSITLLGLGINVFLIVLKLTSGILIRSSALVADGVHSLSDLATDFIVLIGTRMSNRPADESHPYGHSRLETLASQLIALVLMAVSIGLIWSAGLSIYHHQQNFPGPMLLAVAGLSVVLKEIIFFMTLKISRLTKSTALYANAWHHRSDSFSSVAVLVGGVIGLMGWGHADQLATIVIGFMIMGMGGKIFYEGMIEITEHAADRDSIRKIEEVLSEEESISSWHALRTRRLGAELFTDVHILVAPSLSVLESHKVSERLEEKIRKRLPRPVNILVHIEPDIQEMRRRIKER